MNFSRTASYSISVLSYMADHDTGSLSAAFLHAELGIPYPYIRHILANLSKNGFIRSVRGRNGGFVFSRPKEEISVADIIEATDGINILDQCILGFNACPFDVQCSMHARWDSARNGIIKVLKETSLVNLISNSD